MKRVLAWLTVVAGLALAQVEIPFWHSMDGPAGRVIDQFAASFNKKQNNYKVTPRYVGDYRDAETRLVATLRSGAGLPVLFQSEVVFFPRLVSEGSLMALDDLVASLPKALVDDIFDAAWDYGLIGSKRYGLPFNTSTPVLFFNEPALKAKGLAAPKNWAEFARVAQGMTSRQAKGFIAITESWIFEAMVTSRGGNLVKDGKPAFTSPEVVAALEMLQSLNKAGAITPRNLSESTFAQLDFVRTKGMMVFASIANWPAAEDFSFAFKLGVAPVPREPGGKVPLGGAQLTILKTARPEEARGALEFWKHLMEPENIRDWVQASYYVPLRKSATPLLEPFYKENPYRKVAFEQVAVAQPRPRIPQFATWRVFLEEALEKALKGTTPARQALEEAQRKAEAAR